MAKRSTKRMYKCVSIVASLALVIGLMPAPAFAAGDSPDGSAEPVAATESSSTAPDTPDALDEQPVIEEEPAPVQGGEEAGQAPEPAMPEGEAQGPVEETAEGQSDTPQTAPADAYEEETPGDIPGEIEAAADPSQPSDPAMALEDDQSLEGSYLAFKQSKTVNRVTVTVEADADTFPEGATLSVKKVPSAKVEDLIAAKRDAGANVAASYTFDIKVVDADGQEVQPAVGKTVRVSFKAAAVADPNLDVSVYHVADGARKADELKVDVSGKTATAKSDSFSFYTVEFTYDDLQYVLNGGESVPLADILATVGLEGKATDVKVSNLKLFSASNETGDWIVTSHQAFSGSEWMLVTINGESYKIIVTDAEQCTVSASANIAEGGKVTGAGLYDKGATAELVAVPNDGYVFDCWTDGDERIEGAGAEYSFVVDGDRTLVANFREVALPAIADQQYTGTQITPAIGEDDISLVGVDVHLVAGEDYQLEYGENLHAGTGTVIVNFNVKDGKFSGTATKAFTINKAPLTVTAGSSTQVYNGKALTNDSVSAEGLVAGEKIESAQVVGSQTDVGESPNTVESVVVKNASDEETTNDYDITFVAGTLKVNPYTEKLTVKVTGNSATFTYDGAEHEVSGYSIDAPVDFYKATDIAFDGNASVKASNVGVYPMGLTADKFSNKSKNFTNVSFEVAQDGMLTIETAPAKKATLTFHLAGGTLNGTTGDYAITADVGSVIVIPAAPTREGYTFQYWEGSNYNPGDKYKVEGDHEFTAIWKQNGPATHTVTFNANGHGKAPAAQTVEDGKTAKRPANPTENGWTFGGWFTDKACKNQYSFTSPVTSDITLYAKWMKKAPVSASGKSGGSTASTGDTTGGTVAVLGFAAFLALVVAFVAFFLRRRDTFGNSGAHRKM